MKKEQVLRARQGFTLIEIAVVLFIIGLLMAAGVRYLNSQLTSASYSATNTKLATIKDALTTYLGKNKRLPCPDDPGADPALGGTESRGAANPQICIADFGVLPYVTLGIPKDVALDGWGNYFSYAVSTDPSPEWALTYNSTYAGPAAPISTSRGFTSGSTGGLTVKSRLTDNTESTITTSAAAVVLSHGKNGLGAYAAKGTLTVPPDAGTDEAFNTAAGTTFFKREYSDSDNPPFGPFDDAVLVVLADDLITPLTKDGTLTSANGTLNQTFGSLNGNIISFALQNSTGTSPYKAYELPASYATSTLDPWGNPIQYVRNDTVTGGDPGTPTPYYVGTITTTADDSAYRFISYGPDKLPNTPDDITYVMSVSELKGTLAKTGF